MKMKYFVLVLVFILTSCEEKVLYIITPKQKIKLYESCENRKSYIETDEVLEVTRAVHLSKSKTVFEVKYKGEKRCVDDGDYSLARF